MSPQALFAGFFSKHLIMHCSRQSGWLEESLLSRFQAKHESPFISRCFCKSGVCDFNKQNKIKNLQEKGNLIRRQTFDLISSDNQPM